MTDVSTVAARYPELWNERDPARRRDLLAANWTATARYVDPLMAGDDPAAIAGLIAGVQERFPDFRFALLGQPDGHGNHVRFSWGLGPEGGDAPIKGTDIAIVEGGRIAHLIGFLDQVPQAA